MSAQRFPAAYSLKDLLFQDAVSEKLRPPPLRPSSETFVTPVLGHHVFQDVACTACSCVCDDLKVSVDAGQITTVEQGCEKSNVWLLQQTANQQPDARINGQSVDFKTAVQHAAEILSRSRSPLIYGLSNSSTPGQRAACQLADRLRATIDTAASLSHGASTLAAQSVGESIATLGEVRHRSKTIIYWGCDPIKSHPRHMERFVNTSGQFVPDGRSGRQVIVVDVERTATAEVADRFVQIEAGSDFDLLWALRATLKGVELHENSIAGVPKTEILSLAQLFKTGQYVSFFYGAGLTRQGVPHANVEALLRLVTELNEHTRANVRGMRAAGMSGGANNVLTWQTGYPFGVNISRGYPRYNPGEYTADAMLARGEVDAMVLVGSDCVKKLPHALQKQLSKIPTVVLNTPGGSLDWTPAVSFATAVYGVHRPGTAYRMDDVPIPLRPLLETELPSDEDVLLAIQADVN